MKNIIPLILFIFQTLIYFLFFLLSFFGFIISQVTCFFLNFLCYPIAIFSTIS